MILPQPPVLLITDRRQAHAPLEQVAQAALDGGCRALLLRDKDLPRGERVALARRLVALGRPLGAKLLVSADAEAAREAGAAGVHLPRDGDPAAARALLGSGALIGYSAHDLSEAEFAEAAGADYVTLSPVFASAGKPGYGPCLGLDGLAEVSGRIALPVLALGGVTASRLAACLAAGAAGVAVMGAVMGAASPRSAMRRLVATCAAASERSAPPYGKTRRALGG